MATRANEVSSQAPTPTSGPQGSDLRTVANRIEGLLDDDGQFNPSPETLSRGHPDYDADADPRAGGQDRGKDGRFQKAAAAGDDDENLTPEDDENIDTNAASDDSTEDADQTDGDTDENLATSADDASTEDPDTENIESLAALAEALEIPLEEFTGQIKHTFKAAGEDVTVTLAELETGYQKDADYRRSTAKLAEDRRAAEGDYASRMQAYEQQNVVMNGVYQTAEQIIGAELQNPALVQLRESDPAEWTARRDEIGQRLGALRQQREQATANYDNFQAQQLIDLKQRETVALMEAIPDFSESHKGIAKSTLKTLGYTDTEISQVFDHRNIMAALELAALRKEVGDLRELKKAAGNTVKRIKKDVPKLMKPGKQRRSGARVGKDNLAKLRQRANKSGRVEDAAKVIEQLM